MSDENKTLTPVWICYVDGKRLDTKHEGALKSITVRDRLNGIGQCEFLFDTSAEKLLELGDLVLGSEVSVHLGYKDDVEEVFNGVITTFAPQFKEFGHEMVEVICSNALSNLRHGNHYVTAENKTYSEVIKEIIEKYSLNADVDSFGPKLEYFDFDGETDYDFLQNYSKLYGKDFYAYADKIYVKDNIQIRDDEIIFEWGKSLIELEPRINIENLFSEVNCIGWNPLKCSEIVGNAKIADLPIKVGGSNNWTQLIKGGENKFIHNIASIKFFDEEDAKNIALGVLQKNSFLFITAAGTAEGTYKLLPGMRVNIKYSGSKFEGEYIAEKVTHIFDISSGYTTLFYLKRNMYP